MGQVLSLQPLTNQEVGLLTIVALCVIGIDIASTVVVAKDLHPSVHNSACPEAYKDATQTLLVLVSLTLSLHAGAALLSTLRLNACWGDCLMKNKVYNWMLSTMLQLSLFTRVLAASFFVTNSLRNIRDLAESNDVPADPCKTKSFDPVMALVITGLALVLAADIVFCAMAISKNITAHMMIAVARAANAAGEPFSNDMAAVIVCDDGAVKQRRPATPA